MASRNLRGMFSFSAISVENTGRSLSWFRLMWMSAFIAYLHLLEIIRLVIPQRYSNYWLFYTRAKLLNVYKITLLQMADSIFL